MKLKHYSNLFFLCLIGYGVISPPVLSADRAYVKLLDNVIHHQPEQQIVKAIQEIHSANQVLSKSWISGDVDLIVHHENDTLTDSDQYKNWQVGVEFPIWLASQKNAQKQVTLSYGQELISQQVYLKWLASSTLRQLVWEYRNAKVEFDAAKSSLQKTLSFQQKVKQKVNAGESPKLDLLLASKAVLDQKKLLVQKQSALTVAQIQFTKWTQAEFLPKNIKERPHPAVQLEQHPHIVKLISELEISESELKKVKSLKRESPKVFLGAQNNKDTSNENTSLMFEVSIPLGVNPTFSSKVAQQKRNIYESQAIVTKTKMNIEQQILKAQQVLASAKQNIIFSKEQYDISRQALVMSEQAYQLGETNIQNLLIVQQQTAEAKLNFDLAKVHSGRATAELNGCRSFERQSQAKSSRKSII